MEPVIFIDSYHSKDIPLPLTIKPLPVLLAPSNNYDDNNTTFYSSNSSLQLSCSSLSSILKEEEPTSSNFFSVIQKQSKEIQELREDLIKLNQKYIKQIDKIQMAEQIESELEELSRKLFEQANEMVSKEKKKVFELENKLNLVYQQLEDERAQLKELKEKYNNNNNNEDKLFIHHNNNIHLDNVWLTLFKEFIFSSPNTTIQMLNRLPFLKLCLEFDIEPCLRFGNNNNNRLSIKKVLDTIIYEPCFIESDLPKKRHSHEILLLNTKQPIIRRPSFILNPFKSKDETQTHCYACGSILLNDLFKFKLKQSDTNWYWIDRNCRDRLVAVCNFYVFIRHLRLGLQHQKSIQTLFQECLWLKLCMFWARSGVHHSI